MANEKHEPQGSRHPRRKRLSAAAVLFLLVLLAAGFSVRYLSFASRTIYQESTSHLEELLHKSNNMLKEMVRKNLTYLHLYNGFLESTSDEDEIQAYIEAAQQNTGFADFYFLTYDGNYMTVTGETGYLGLQTNLDEKLAHDEDVVVNTALPGKPQMLAFICPETQGSYRGFAYDAIAISYYNDAVLRLLDNSAFEGNASNYVIYPDGRVVIDNSVNRKETIYNFLATLRDHSDLSEEQILALSDAFAQGSSGNLKVKLGDISYKKKHMTSFQLIIMGFAGVILLGTVLLMLPFSSAEKVITPFHEALFTATSAVCVTGLVVKDTGSYWSLAGQTIILALIQIGGLGVVTVAASVSLLSGKKISLMQRSTMQNAISAPKVGGIVRLTRFILRGTFLIEAAGTVLLLPVFMGDYGKKGIWMSVFHSISAFCNAGFDILGTDSSMFPSLTRYSGNILINLVIMLLIITGGIGFLTWDDIYTNKLNFKRYRMQSKIILMTTACLILFPTVFFYICDLTKLPMEKRLLAAAFQSVTTRTAGFNTINISEMSEASKAVMILLMLIGGSPGSTAGGMKTTTFSVLILNAIATFRSQENAGAFGRRLEYHVIKNAATIAMLYFALFFGGGIAISVYEGFPLLDCLYEAASAVGTVGLTLGITPELHVFSQVVLIILMYLGRVGGLTLIYAVFSGRNKGNAKLPLEKITVG